MEAQLRHEAEVRQIADEYRDMTHAAVIARGLNYANCFEFALKLMETSYVAASAFSGADFAHGPIAMVDEGFPVFVFTPPGPTAPETARLLRRLAGSRADAIAIGTEAATSDLPFSHRMQIFRAMPEPAGFPADLLTPIPSIIPAQLFAAHLATCKGLDPDHPRMLTKVTQTM